MENLLDFPSGQALWYAVILLMASYIRGFSGFGFTAIFFAGLTFILPVIEIVPLSIALELTASSAQMSGILKHIKWRELGILLATGITCTPIGVYLLGHIDDQTLRLTALVFVFASSLYLVFWRARLRRFSPSMYALVGSAIGVINGATALSGLVLALFFSFSNERAAEMRATMIFYLFAADVWAFFLLIEAGYYDSVSIIRAVASLPLLAIGLWLGTRHFAAVGAESYRTIVLWLLLLLSTAGLVGVFTTLPNLGQ
ncbi:sulfite exporter TauE/SafE family protein [Ruegeria arenilitoris]|uniref:sulfite exporter TauE/SafE family protein n=1 Tax=Ruegeria arenilitoris TaxID=1173585 RepID=UPI00147ECAA6|nr:sulfite exporter TauE/SafE family protein [Ruegeria arenilitoris]